MKKLCSIILTAILVCILAMCVFCIAACNEDSNEEKVPATGISISGTGVNNGKIKGMTGSRDVPLSATIRPSDATEKTVTWTSSNPEVATVSETGVLHYVAGGTATITATVGKVSDTLEVTVEQRIAVTSVSFKQESYQATILSGSGGTLDLFSEIVVAPQDATNSTVTWAIEPQDEYVAISAQGLVILSEHVSTSATYTVTATSVSDPTVKGSTTISISQPQAENIVVRLSSNGSAKVSSYVYEFYLDDDRFDKICFVAETRPVGTQGICTFESANPEICDIISVNENNAYIDIKAVGETDFTISCGTIKKVIHIKINPPAGYILSDLNVTEDDLQTEVDNRNYWDFNANPTPKPSTLFWSRQEKDETNNIWLLGRDIDGLGWNSKLMPNQGNGAYIEDGGWCAVFTTWDWPFDNEQTNGYIFNKIHAPVGATTLRVQLRTMSDQYKSGMAKVRIRLVDANDYTKQVFLDANGQLVEGFTAIPDRPVEDKISYADGEFNPENGWLIIPGVPDYMIGEDIYFFTIPEEWRDKDVFMFIENDELYEDDGFGHRIVGKCDVLLVCSIAIVSNANDVMEFVPAA